MPNASGAYMTGPPAPPSAIGTVGRISRSHDHTESNPMRSASAATCRMMLGEAPLPATGRWTPNLIAVISRPCRRSLVYPDLISRQFSSAAGPGPDVYGGAGAEAYAAGMSDRTRAARVEDVRRLSHSRPEASNSECREAST